MERPNYIKQLLPPEMDFASIAERYDTTVQLNEDLGIGFPVITNNVYKDIILYSMMIKDDYLDSFISESIFDPDMSNTMLKSLIADTILQILSGEELDPISAQIAEFVKRELDRADYADRRYIGSYIEDLLMEYGGVGWANVRDEIEKLGFADVYLGIRGYKHHNISVLRAAELMVTRPSIYENVSYGGTLDAMSIFCALYCTAIGMAVRRYDTVEEIESKVNTICNLMIFSRDRRFDFGPQAVGRRVLEYILRACEANIAYATGYRSEICLAISVVEEINDVSIAELIQPGSLMEKFLSPGG